MEKYTDNFCRTEHKYLITRYEAEKFQELAEPFLKDDLYPQYNLHNIYYDTLDNLLIIRSLNQPVYKEKLRMRSYGDPDKDTPVFAEIKKKYKGIVYKRRIALPYEQAQAFLDQGILPEKPSQITKEIGYMLAQYRPEKKLYISYDRRAYSGSQEQDVRVTLDTNIRYRCEDLSLLENGTEQLLLEEDAVLLEIKVSERYPVWLSNILTEMKIYRSSFSKYGAIYTRQKYHPYTGRSKVSEVTEMEGNTCLIQF